MEVLLRGCGDGNYEWKNATWRNGRYYTVDDLGFEYGIREVNILAVRNDERVGKVMCSWCHELIPNDEASIEQHFAENEAKRDCLKCSDMSIGSHNNSNYVYVPNKDGTYNITETFTAQLECNIGYWGESIHSERAKRECKYMQCRRRGVHQIEDIFVKYPNPFDRQITVDVLNAKKYQYEAYYDGHFIYDMKARNTLKAYVNELGIVDHFVMTHRGYDFDVYYSDKYKKLFYIDGGRYKDNLASHTSESKVNSTINKISELFKEENGNDEK